MSDFNSYGEQPVVGLAPLFFRVADRMRLEGYVAALVDDNMSLSLVSGHEAILDHYGRLLVARLREAAPHIGLEVYFPASADALITRFNEVLQSYSIEDAMGSKAPAAPAKSGSCTTHPPCPTTKSNCWRAWCNTSRRPISVWSCC